MPTTPDDKMVHSVTTTTTQFTKQDVLDIIDHLVAGASKVAIVFAQIETQRRSSEDLREAAKMAGGEGHN